MKANIFEDAFPSVSSTEDEELIDFSLNIPPLSVGDLSERHSRILFQVWLKGLVFRRCSVTNLPLGLSGTVRQAPPGWNAQDFKDTQQVLICTGALHAMTVVFSTLTKPGDSGFH